MELGAIGTLKEWHKPFKYENALKVCRDGARNGIWTIFQPHFQAKGRITAEEREKFVL